jgi:hypothetical protein
MIRRSGPSWIACLVFLFGPVAVLGEIGDSREKLHARYGAGKEVGDQLLFTHDNYFLSVYFVGNFASMEVYTLAPDPKGDSRDWTEAHRNELLKRQGSGLEWQLGKSQTHTETYWIRQDQQVAARFVLDKKIMVFLSMHPEKLSKP